MKGNIGKGFKGCTRGENDCTGYLLLHGRPPDLQSDSLSAPGTVPLRIRLKGADMTPATIADIGGFTRTFNLLVDQDA